MQFEDLHRVNLLKPETEHLFEAKIINNVEIQYFFMINTRDLCQVY